MGGRVPRETQATACHARLSDDLSNAFRGLTMRFVAFALLVATTLLNAMPATGGEAAVLPEPLCADAAPKASGCWLPLDNVPDCHVWLEYIPFLMGAADWRRSQPASFDGPAACESGKLVGNGTLTIGSRQWRGRYVDGREEGRFVVVDTGGYRSESYFVRGRKAGLEEVWSRDDDDGPSRRHVWLHDPRRSLASHERRRALPVGDRPDCYVADPRGYVVHDHAISVGEFKCEGRLLSGTGTVRYLVDHAKWDHIDEESATRHVEVWSGSYLAGVPHGAFSIFRRRDEESLGPGYRYEATYDHGVLARDGHTVTRDGRGRILVASTYVDGKVVDVELPLASPPPVAPGQRSAPTITGGFGVELGPDISLFKTASCDCLDQLSGLHHDGTSSVGFNPPRPIPGAWLHYARVDVLSGIVEVGAAFRYGTAEKCASENDRIAGILTQKYGECTLRGREEYPNCERFVGIGDCRTFLHPDEPDTWAFSVEYSVNPANLPGLAQPSAADF